VKVAPFRPADAFDAQGFNHLHDRSSLPAWPYQCWRIARNVDRPTAERSAIEVGEVPARFCFPPTLYDRLTADRLHRHAGARSIGRALPFPRAPQMPIKPVPPPVGK
jgi:hypothetical protein